MVIKEFDEFMGIDELKINNEKERVIIDMIIDKDGKKEMVKL